MKTLKRILTLLLTIQLVVTLVGFSVYYHICSCKNTIIASALVEDSCCETHQQTTDSCCENEAPSCHKKSHKDCNCKTELKVFTLKNSFTPTYTVINFQPIGVDYDLHLKIIDTEPISNKVAISFETLEPPPKWGKALVISNHSLKIPFPIS